MVRGLIGILLSCVCASALQGQASPAYSKDLHWSFAKDQGATPVDSVSGVRATLDGYYAYAPGVTGDAVRFDGYTTSMRVPVKEGEGIGHDGFTLEAWVALNTYPWNWIPVIDQEDAHEEGFFLGIDAFGHFSVEASIDGQWQRLVSAQTLPLKKWAHIAGTYETHNGQGVLAIYLNGAQVAQMPVHGVLSTARTDILIGRVREATLPFPEAVVKPQYPIWYSLDGLLTEVTIDAHPLTAAEIAAEVQSAHAPAGDVLPWQKMPSGPAGPGKFGAYATTLKYQDAWDRIRRIGPDADVVVRFDDSGNHLVFWQGTNYIPAWVTENDKWYTDEFLETWDSAGCHGGGDCEPMSDKQSRYSHVNILESNDARVVVHWRYAMSEVEHDEGAFADPRTGWFDWADEYWTVYPDGVAIRKIVLHADNPSRAHEWQETIVLHQPGSTPNDDINHDAVTLENMQGATKTYTWQSKPAGSFSPPFAPPGVTGPREPNIQIVNLKSNWKPFQIVSPEGASADIYNNEDTYYDFECWNHWPVAQILSSDRPCVTDDRASHSSLSHLYWEVYAQDENTATKIMMDGLTQLTPAQLLPLAKSWLTPPTIQMDAAGYRSDGYDPTQRAFVVTKTESSATRPLHLTLAASAAAPLFNPAIVIRGWGDRAARLSINGKPVVWGRTARMGHEERLDGTDLVIWIERQSTDKLVLGLTPLER
ncbi:MAG: LamG domain-containing protein [Acidobacteriaceae bacterium]